MLFPIMVVTSTLMGPIDFLSAAGEIVNDIAAKAVCVPGRVFDGTLKAGKAVGTVAGKATSQIAEAVVSDPLLFIELFPGGKLGRAIRAGAAAPRTSRAAHIALDLAKDHIMKSGYQIIGEQIGFRGQGEELQIFCDLVTRSGEQYFCVKIKDKRNVRFTTTENRYYARTRMIGQFIALTVGTVRTSSPKEVVMDVRCYDGNLAVDCSAY